MEAFNQSDTSCEPCTGRIYEGKPLGSYEDSIGEMLLDREKHFSDKILFMQKANGAYRSYSWREIMHDVRSVGAALIERGLKPCDRVAILSENRREMIVSELAIMSIGALSVPIFAGYPADQVEYIIRDSGARRLILSTYQQLMKVAECSTLSDVEAITFIDYERSQIKVDSICGVRVETFGELSEEGSNSHKRFLDASAFIKPDDSCFLMYTSGTTGDPKGVELTHRNILSQQAAIKALWNISPSDRFLSYLPWHHSFGGLFERFMSLYNGAAMAIDDGGGRDIEKLISNWREVKPTVFFSVPGVYQRLADEIVARRDVREAIFHNDLRFVFTAAAPLPPDLSRLFAEAKIPVLEGWGLTETSPCVTLTDPEAERIQGVVGWPIPGVKIKISQEGEVLVNGPNVMRGYYKLPTKNREAFDKDGWFRTGDLGEITEKGLKILGRQDGVFKLLNAEKVYATQIEMALIGGSPFIDQAVVVGSGRHYVTALIYANRKVIEEWAAKNGIRVPEGDDIGTVSDIRRLFSCEVQRINNEIGGRYQRVRKFIVFRNPPLVENGELTPSSKVIRHKVMHNKADIIESLYKQGCPPPLNTIVCLGDCY